MHPPGETLSSPALQLSLASNLGEVRTVAAALRTFLFQQGCTEPEVMDCELALVEACNNAIQYATGAKTPRIEVEVSCSPKEIKLSVVDHTSGFDWPEQAKLPPPESERGRGLFLIQAVMSSTQYTRSPSGNTLTLAKIRAR